MSSTRASSARRDELNHIQGQTRNSVVIACSCPVRVRRPWTTSTSSFTNTQRFSPSISSTYRHICVWRGLSPSSSTSSSSILASSVSLRRPSTRAASSSCWSKPWRKDVEKHLMKKSSYVLSLLSVARD